MASPTPTPDEVRDLIARSWSAAYLAAGVRGRHRRRSRPDNAERRRELGAVHATLVALAEELRRERIRAARDKNFATLWGGKLADTSAAIKRERYKVYRMLNPGGQKWTQ